MKDLRLAAALLSLAPAAALAAKRPAPPAPAAAPVAADWRTADPQNVLIIDTSKGRIVVELAPAAAPAAVAQVRALARAGTYDGRAFFRVIDNFMDQTGDPKDDGTGGSTRPNLPPEFTFRRNAATPLAAVGHEGGTDVGFVGSLPVVSQSLDLAPLTSDHKVNAWGTFCPGVAGMARSDAPDSANSQFFLMRAAQTNLDQKYTPFGRVIAGMDVVRAIKIGEPPTPPMDTMTKVRVLADLPPAERPAVRVIDPAGPWFRAKLERQRADTRAEPQICDIDLPAEAK